METNKTALLVMDLQMGIVSRLPDQGKAVVNKVAGAIKAAREKNIMVIFVRLGFQKGLPEISAANKLFATVKTQLAEGNKLESYMQLHPGLDVRENDIIINKKRISAFSGNELETILRAQQIEQLVLSGMATSGIVLSTLREAFDKDYHLTVLSDGCADADEEIHGFLMNRLFIKQAAVLSADAWIETLI